MYEIDGEFGRVRHIRIPVGNIRAEVPFAFFSGGWHCCNEKYQYQRDGSQQSHLLLFSLSEGGMIQIEGEDPISLPPCSVAWLPPGKGHRYGTMPGKLWEFYWVHTEDMEVFRFDKIFRQGLVVPLSDRDYICKVFENMIRSRYADPREFYIEGSAMISNLYHMLLKESVKQMKQKSRWDELVHGIIQEMEEECDREWCLPELAEKYYISVPQLIRRFKAQTGLTPHAYLMTIRLRAAEMYLKYTNMSVEEISKEIGFSNTSNFIYQFRKEKGMSPGKYRLGN